MTCPKCHRNNIELMNQMNLEADYCRMEEYLCHDCGCEWNWTLKRQFFHWRRKIRAPKWVTID